MKSASDKMIILGSRRGPLPLKAIGQVILCLLRDSAGCYCVASAASSSSHA